jgi:hypothetical protein
MRLQFYLLSICVALSSCSSDEGNINEEVQLGYEVSLIDGFEYRLYPSCTDTALFGVTKTKTIKTLDTNLYSTQIIICRTDTFSVLGNEVIFKWKPKEWAQPSSDRKGWENAYPEGTYFTWWGCIDSVIVNGQSYPNTVRSTAMPTYAIVFLSSNKEKSNCCSDSSLVISIDAGSGAHFTGSTMYFK